MKRFLIPPFVPFLLAVALAQAPVPGLRLISGGSLQKTRNIDSSGLVGPADLRGQDKEVWIAIRTDGKHGNGTAQDPFDGSSAAKLDAIYAANSADTKFHYTKGTFQTAGWRFGVRRTANPGCKHYGAGMDRTVIQLVEASNGPADGVIFGCDGTQRTDGFELHDLTLDCNAAAQPKWTNTPGAYVTGVFATGSNIVIDHVHVIHFGTRHRGDECFPIYLVAQNVPGTYENNQVEYCIVDSPVTGNADTCTAIGLGAVDHGNHPVARNCVARYNRVDLTGSDFAQKQAIYAQIVENNYVRGCSKGFYAEPDGVEIDVIVRNNRFENCVFAFQISAHVNSFQPSITFENNEFIDCGTGEFRSDDGLNHIGQATITKNTFRRSDGALFKADHALTIDSSVANCVIANNRIDAADSPKGAVIYSAAANQTISENRTLAGKPVSYWTKRPLHEPYELDNKSLPTGD